MASKQACGEPEWWNRQFYQFKQVDEVKEKLARHENALVEAQRELSRLRTQLLEIEINEWDEDDLRNKHPGLKQLWDQYQTMLRLVQENTDDGD